MSRDASITLDWADGTYQFRLAWGQLVELQEKVDAGPFVILQRLNSGGWRVQDISQVIRLGLVGGGMKQADALKLVRLHVEAFPPAENLMVAQAVLAAGLMGAPDEEIKKNGAAMETESTASPTASFEQPTSTDRAQ